MVYLWIGLSVSAPLTDSISCGCEDIKVRVSFRKYVDLGLKMYIKVVLNDTTFVHNWNLIAILKLARKYRFLVHNLPIKFGK